LPRCVRVFDQRFKSRESLTDLTRTAHLLRLAGWSWLIQCSNKSASESQYALLTSFGTNQTTIPALRNCYLPQPQADDEATSAVLAIAFAVPNRSNIYGDDHAAGHTARTVLIQSEMAVPRHAQPKEYQLASSSSTNAIHLLLQNVRDWSVPDHDRYL
jgi:hypothetical protein